MKNKTDHISFSLQFDLHTFVLSQSKNTCTTLSYIYWYKIWLREEQKN